MHIAHSNILLKNCNGVNTKYFKFVHIYTHFERDVFFTHKKFVILSNSSALYAGYRTYLFHSVGNQEKKKNHLCTQDNRS